MEILTGGVPRAIVAVIDFVGRNPENCLDLSNNSIAGQKQDATLQCELLERCPFVATVDQPDLDAFKTLLDLAWSRTLVPPDATLYGEPVSAAMARLGFYSQPTFLDTRDDSFYIVMPLHILRAQKWRPSCLGLIRSYYDSGLATRYCRMLFLRLSRASERNWTSVGLSKLDKFAIPFPPQEDIERRYSFLRITDEASPGTEEDVRVSMDAIHGVKRDGPREREGIPP